jgi:phosphatidylinositol-3-phosphatase
MTIENNQIQASAPNNQRHEPKPSTSPAHERCAECGAALVEDQRYCLQCGARRGLPRLDFTAYWRPASPSSKHGGRSSGSSGGGGSWGASGSTQASWSHAPSRRLGALLLAAVLAGGILAGAALGPNPPNSPAEDSTLAERAVAALVANTGLDAAAPASTPTAASASTPAADTSAAEHPAASKHASSSGSESSGGGGPESGSPGSSSTEGGSSEGSSEGGPSEGSSSKGSSEGSEAAPGTPIKLPPIKHIWVISLSGTSLLPATAKGQSGYLAKQLVPKGALLSAYKLTGPSSLANGIAVLSGQGVNLDTEQNCPTYSDLQPPTVSSTGLAEGVGCVYPAPVQTLADELTAAGLTWKAYVQAMEGGQSSSTAAASPSASATAGPSATSPANPATASPSAPATSVAGSPAASATASCRHPALGAPDPDQAPAAGAPYLTYRNPFVYFHSLLDGGACAGEDVDYTHLQSDLAAPSSTPNLSWIVPSACDDGSATPCSPGAPAGLAPAQRFLEEVVPRILATAAYREGGLIAIVPDSPPASPGSGGPGSSASPRSGGSGSSGSAAAKSVGALLLSPFVRPGARVTESLNDFSLLKSLSRLFGVLPLGHANDPSVASFGATVYGSSGKTANAASTAKKAAQAAQTTPPGG